MPEILNLCQRAPCSQVIELLDLPKPFCFPRVVASEKSEEGLGKNIKHKIYVRKYGAIYVVSKNNSYFKTRGRIAAIRASSLARSTGCKSAGLEGKTSLGRGGSKAFAGTGGGGISSFTPVLMRLRPVAGSACGSTDPPGRAAWELEAISTTTHSSWSASSSLLISALTFAWAWALIWSHAQYFWMMAKKVSSRPS